MDLMIRRDASKDIGMTKVGNVLIVQALPLARHA